MYFKRKAKEVGSSEMANSEFKLYFVGGDWNDF